MFFWLKKLNPFSTVYRIEETKYGFRVTRNIGVSGPIHITTKNTLDEARAEITADKAARFTKTVWEE